MLSIEQAKLEELKQISRILTVYVALPLYLSFWILDLLYVPQFKWEFLSIRLGFIPLTFIILYLLTRAQTYRQTEYVTYFLIFCSATVLNYMIYRIGSGALYSISLNLVAIAGLGFISWSRFFYILTTATIYGPFILIEYSRLTTDNYDVFFVSCFYTTGVITITTFMQLYRQRLRDKELVLRKELEEEVERRKQSEQQLIDARDQALAATKAKSGFLANMSHELRTPLTAIIGFADVLNHKSLEKLERKKYLNIIDKNAQHLLSVINNILDLSKIEANRLEVSISQVALFDLIQDLDKLISSNVQQRELEFSINTIFPLPKNIYTDELRLKQILINLSGNATKFTRKGSITLDIQYNHESSLLEFAVIDTGIGLSEEHIEKVFDSFTQADSATTKEYGGTGLGLSISMQLAKLLGGDITVESTLGRGSCFRVSIDPGKVSELEFIDEAPKYEHPDSATYYDPEKVAVSGKILLAEDVEMNQLLICRYLKDMGVHVDIANNGQEALEKAKNNAYDLILMDMQMPVMDGLEAVERLRADKFTQPIAMLTANAMEEDKKRCSEAGSNDFITKPIDVKALASVVNKYLKPAA